MVAAWALGLEGLGAWRQQAAGGCNKAAGGGAPMARLCFACAQCKTVVCSSLPVALPVRLEPAPAGCQLELGAVVGSRHSGCTHTRVESQIR